MNGFAYGLPPTPPSTPPPSSTPESRIGRYIGPRGSTLQLKAILGTGAYGVVYLARDYRTGTRYAVKALSKTNPRGEPLDSRQQDFQDREIRLHYAASAHPNIVSMHRIVEDEDCTYVVLEYCPEGDLFSNITEKGRYIGNDHLVRAAFLQILDAVAHCHHYGIFHRDLKPENILVSDSGSKVLLADFGLATKDKFSDDHGCGSTFYMSPECLDQASRNTAYQCAPNDIWSLGVILVNLTCGRNPWKQASTLDSTYRAFTKDANFLKTILPLSDDLNRLLGMIFERNPEKRIKVDQLREEIERCPSFSAPPQPIQETVQVLTPPTSPDLLPVQEAPSPMDISMSGSEGSLSSSGSSDSDYDSDAGSVLTEPDSDPLETIENPVTTPPTKPQQRITAPAPFTPPSYVLPPQEYSPNPWATPLPMKPVPWTQPWAYGCYDIQYDHHYTSPVYHVPHYQSFLNPHAYYCPPSW